MVSTPAGGTVRTTLVARYWSPSSRKLSLISCTITAILSVWVAVPLAYLMSRYQFRGKALGQLVFEPLGTLRAEIEAGGNVQGDDPDLIACADAVQRGGLRRTAGQQCGDQ